MITLSLHLSCGRSQSATKSCFSYILQSTSSPYRKLLYSTFPYHNYYKVLVQQSTGPLLQCVTPVQYCKVLLQNYSAPLQSTTPRFPPGLRSSWDAWFKRCKVLLSFRRERWLRRRSWLGGQCGGPACSESRCNPLLDDGGWLSGCGSCEIADKGGGLLARPAPTLGCKHHQTAALVVGNI